ncbi:ensconsin isoform X3 [Ornithorhynchus anatinus]|uniref:Microtubule associated protein 7 n=1 Tax=Ornithorhynchus anatinus TaxID=9258 RepID=A0A6I8NB89_ORNAN|nr:ensconsin isoform X3 [Ornithorhynchus anatinus]
MQGSAIAVRQERLKKTSPRLTPPGLFTINEEDEQQKNGNSRNPKASEGSKGQDKKTATSSHPNPATSGQSGNHSGNKPDHQPVLRVDDRQRLARERREEREKQLAARETVWLEREERARQHYEKLLEERKKKLEEQRLKEERRRAAVEEKRRQRLEEDKERHEAVVRRTMERSHKPKQKQLRWSWGGPLHSSSSNHMNNADPDRRSVSTMNLSKHVDPVISKRLSSSSATLLNSPDRARRLQLSPWESSIVNRLQMPTHSFLARSKSTAALSGDPASCSPISIMSYKAAHCRNLADRPKLFVTTPQGTARRRTIHSTMGDRKEKERENPSLLCTSSLRRAHSPTNPKARSPAPSPVWLPSKSFPHLPGTPRPAPSLPSSSSKAVSAQPRPPSPGNIRPGKKEGKAEGEKKDREKDLEKVREEISGESKGPVVSAGDVARGEGLSVKPPVIPAALAPASAPLGSTPSPTSTKTSAGTTDAEEATRILAENRRLAREQREREERERKEKEELERQKKEELAQKVAEERARREEESRRLEAERKEREQQQAREKEEQLRQQAEEREQREREELERIQKQREEEARMREEAEKVRQEREKHFQREEQERLERKKRLEEIMKRTRRTEAADKKVHDQRNGDISKGNIPGGTGVSSPPCGTDSSKNGEPGASPQVAIAHQLTGSKDGNAEKQPTENGVSSQNDSFEEMIDLPIGSKANRLDATNSDGSPEIPLTPILAFEDKGTLGSLPQVDSVQTQQTAEVI